MEGCFNHAPAIQLVFASHPEIQSKSHEYVNLQGAWDTKSVIQYLWEIADQEYLNIEEIKS